MLTMHPTLLIGPYDWDPQLVPEIEFRERIQSLWEKLADKNITGVIVYGDSRNHAELMYLSNFLPKLGPALLLVPRSDEPTLLVSGAPNMLAAARRITWVERTVPLRDPSATVRNWLSEFENTTVSRPYPRGVVIGGESMRGALYNSLCEFIGPEAFLTDATSSLRDIMRRKRPVELLLIRQACAILTTANSVLADAKAAGANTSSAIIAAEQAARRAGAQDVRTLFSLDGGRTLRPFEHLVDTVVDPLQVYLAVRFAGYWAEGFVHMSVSAQPVAAKATDALTAIIAEARAGVTWRDLSRLAVDRIQPYGEHALTAGSIGNSIGLFLAEEPQLSADGAGALESGSVYSLRVGAADESAQYAIVSALVYIHDQDSELLWSAV